MSPQEFKSLNQNFVKALQEKFPDKAIRTKQHPFGGLLIGIPIEDKSNFCEIYELSNNGDVAEWKYRGDGQL